MTEPLPTPPRRSSCSCRLPTSQIYTCRHWHACGHTVIDRALVAINGEIRIIVTFLAGSVRFPRRSPLLASLARSEKARQLTRSALCTVSEPDEIHAGVPGTSVGANDPTAVALEAQAIEGARKALRERCALPHR